VKYFFALDPGAANKKSLPTAIETSSAQTLVATKDKAVAPSAEVSTGLTPLATSSRSLPIASDVGSAQVIVRQPLPVSTVYGACPITDDGASEVASNVTAKWGTWASARLFFGSTLTKAARPAGVLLHVSAKPPLTITDAQIDDWLAWYAGHIVTLYHESDNDGLSATARGDRIGLWNRLYDRNVALGHPCMVSHVFVGTFWGASTTDATRDLWMNTAKGDLIGLDYDGVHDLHTAAPPDGVSYYANTGAQTGTSNLMSPATRLANIQRYLVSKAANGWTGYTIPEFGTSVAPWDTNGHGRAAWLANSTSQFLATNVIPTPAYAVHLYDDRVGTKDDVLYASAPTPTATDNTDYDYWHAKTVSNPAWSG
jgi:hypothetical protein